MRLLLDTNIVIWAVMDQGRLAPAARSMIRESSAVLVSAVSIWEIAMKAALGKLEIDMNELIPDMAAAGFQSLSVTWEHGRAAGSLPPYHRDPFDRMLIVQAMLEPARLLTSDTMLARYSELVTVV